MSFISLIPWHFKFSNASVRDMSKSGHTKLRCCSATSSSRSCRRSCSAVCTRHWCSSCLSCASLKWNSRRASIPSGNIFSLYFLSAAAWASRLSTRRSSGNVWWNDWREPSFSAASQCEADAASCRQSKNLRDPKSLHFGVSKLDPTSLRFGVRKSPFQRRLQRTRVRRKMSNHTVINVTHHVNYSHVQHI